MLVFFSIVAITLRVIMDTTRSAGAVVGGAPGYLPGIMVRHRRGHRTCGTARSARAPVDFTSSRAKDWTCGTVLVGRRARRRREPLPPWSCTPLGMPQTLVSIAAKQVRWRAVGRLLTAITRDGGVDCC
jgi:hypothetical protein